MHFLFWRKNEKFRKSRNNQNSFFKILTSLMTKIASRKDFSLYCYVLLFYFFFNLFKKYIFKVIISFIPQNAFICLKPLKLHTKP
jgi:hypothetical protein